MNPGTEAVQNLIPWLSEPSLYLFPLPFSQDLKSTPLSLHLGNFKNIAQSVTN